MEGLDEMSVKAMEWAWEQRGLTSTQKLVLMRIAWKQHGDSGLARETHGASGEYCGEVSGQTVCRATAVLADLGILRRVQLAGQGARYELAFDERTAPREPTSFSETGDETPITSDGGGMAQAMGGYGANDAPVPTRPIRQERPLEAEGENADERERPMRPIERDIFDRETYAQRMENPSLRRMRNCNAWPTEPDRWDPGLKFRDRYPEPDICSDAQLMVHEDERALWADYADEVRRVGPEKAKDQSDQIFAMRARRSMPLAYGGG